ncbi:MAG: T9SS type A sorting domain-containing protein [Paludibacter sp.]|nr:T9SS type A sorting domain-containing protein [Paludibacter sp.]
MKNKINKSIKAFICLIMLSQFIMSSDIISSDYLPIGFIKVTPIEANHIINTYQNLIIVDVRSTIAFENKHILGAISIPLAEIKNKISSIDKLSTILVYGNKNENDQAARLLWKEGFESIYSLSIDSENLEYKELTFIETQQQLAISRSKDVRNSKSPASSKSYTSSNYCSSVGGSTSYEYIQNIQLSVLSKNVISITVEIFIANPTNCLYGYSCPDYDNSPEYINAWIDWNGNNVFESQERVLNASLTGYSGINYKGTMSTSTVVLIPDNAKMMTWLRVNLGWNMDPNDPCQYSWDWGDVVDKEIMLLDNPPVIEDIIITGMGVPDSKFPLTYDPSKFNKLNIFGEEKVKFEAKVKMDENYEITEVCWSGNDIISGKGNPYNYRASQGSHGNKKVNCMVVYKHKSSGTIGNLTKTDNDFKLFFHTEGYDRGRKNPPNWFRYWKEDKAVPGMENANYAKGSKYEWGTMDKFGNLTLYPGCARSHYYKPIVIENSSFGRESFGGPQVTGVDCVAEVIAHENYHNWVNEQHKEGNSFHMENDSDRDLENGKNDRLPDFYENETSLTLNTSTDTYNIKKLKGVDEYAKYGDEEYMAMRAGNILDDIKKANHKKDWSYSKSYPGKIQAEGLSTKTFASILQSNLNSSDNSVVQFTGNFSDSVVNNDINGLNEFLRIGAEINVINSGSLGLSAMLYSMDTTMIAAASLDTILETGIHNLFVDFEGVDIVDSNIDGPYLVKLQMLNLYGDENDRADFVTGEYLISNFKPKDAYFLEQLSFFGKDIDNDSKFDSLVFNIGININLADYYRIEGGLFDKNGSIIEFVTRNIFLEKNNQTVQLTFDGKKINNTRLDSPYYIKCLGLIKDNLIDFRNDAYTIQGLTYTDFQSSIASFNGNFIYEGIDTDGDSLYNFLKVNIGVNAKSDGQYKLFGSIFDQQNNLIINGEGLVNLHKGENSVEIIVDGKTMNVFGIDGPYIMKNLALSDVNGTIVDFLTIADTTSYFLHTDFQPPSKRIVTLQGVYCDFKTDIDSDCIYDYLTVESEVLLTDPGYVIAKARLVDAKGNDICWAENITYLRSDTTQFIMLNFNGEAIYKNKENGPYSVKNFYIYHTGDPTVPDYVLDAYTSKSYCYSEFDTLPGMQAQKNETICKGDSLHIGNTTLSKAGQYILNLNDINGCDSIVTLTLNVDDVSKPNLSAIVDTLKCDLEGEYYKWYLNDEQIEGDMAQSYIIESSGYYQVAIINKNGCQSPRSDSIFVTKTSVENIDFDRYINVYPNPTIDKIIFERINCNNEVLLQIFTITGIRVYSQIITTSNMEIDLSGYLPGIYCLIITQKNMIKFHKIIKE